MSATTRQATIITVRNELKLLSISFFVQGEGGTSSESANIAPGSSASIRLADVPNLIAGATVTTTARFVGQPEIQEISVQGDVPVVYAAGPTATYVLTGEILSKTDPLALTLQPQ